MKTEPGYCSAPDVIETLELLLRTTEKNGHTIALIYPDESADFIRGYVDGQIDVLRLALDHAGDFEKEFVIQQALVYRQEKINILRI